MTKTTLNFHLKSCFLLLSFWGYSQNVDILKQPQPAIHNIALNEVDHELIENRTKYSRTFLNTNQTKTTVQSSTPLHYQDNNGDWQSIDYRLSKNGNKIIYPIQNPIFEFDSGKSFINIGDQRIKIAAQSNFTFVSNNNVVKKITTTKQNAVLKGDNEIVFRNVLPNVDKTITLYNQAAKYNYVINNAAVLAEEVDYLLVEEVLELPQGFSMREESNRLIIVNQKGEESIVFQQPIISDSKTFERNLRAKPYEGKYQLVKVNENNYKIQIKIEGSWLKSADRIFPINIDPVVTVTNTNLVNSCFLPSYQQSTLQVAVPAGQTVLSSDISYDFVAVAGTGAWMSDQRSYVSGPNGQTPVTNGIGGTSGMYTYSVTNSPIGNIVSTGQIDFTFNFSRNWGGTTCDAAYDFVDRREVTVTYGTITFGNGPLVINEYCASNRNFNDGFGRNEDWIELYNSSPDTYFNLADYYLSNNINNPTKWQIESGAIPPHSRVLVFCSNRDFSSGTVFHTNFDLSQTVDADQVVLTNPSGNIIESHEMFVTQTNHSYGRTTDGAATWSVFTTPTPGQANTNGFSNYATKPTLSVAPGKYGGPITVALSSTGTNEQIRYTTNGSTPTITSTLYFSPITVAQSTVIRARAFSTATNILPGFIETNSYFINDNSSLPVVSISGDANLTQLLNGTQNEPTGYFEYFETNGTFVDETMGDFDKHGNDSWAYNQRGIDFIARDDHGYKKRLEHKFFSTTDRTNFRRFILKAGASDNYPGQTGGAHIRDVFAQKLSEMSNLELDERRSTFVSLFVNGQYWGIYDLREKVDDNQYTDYYYGQDYKFRDSDDYIQYIKTWGETLPEFGNQPAIDAWESLMAYVQNNDMSIEFNYNYVESQLNIDSLVDYFVFNSYLVNKDWLNWNTSWWRGLDPSGGAKKWRYALWDVDGILGHYINYTGIPDISANASPCNVENLEGVGVGHVETIKKLVDESPIVHQKYVTRYADLLNTKFSCERVTAIFDSIVAVITPEMPRQIQRWGGNMATWQANVLAARNFLLTRCSQTISTGLVSCYNVTGPFETTFQVEPVDAGKIKMNSEWFATYPATAQIFGNIETILKAQPNTGYVFDHWVVDGAVIDPDANNPDITLQISQATTVTAYFTEVQNTEAVVYYWHFNSLNTPTDVTTIPADYKQIASASPLMIYTGSGPRNIDAYSTGSAVNLHMDQTAGKSARVRNPSNGRALVFSLPTTGYKDIKFGYAIQRSGEGQLIHHISYSLDGLNFIQDALSQSAFNVSTDFGLVAVDLSAVTGANNNPNFKIQIAFEGNTTADNGNNRFDNITLKGVAINLATQHQNITTYQIFPNPFTSNIQIISSEQMSELSVFDMVGKRILQKSIANTTSETIDLEGLNVGVYLLKIKTPKGIITHKLLKQ